MSRSLQAKLNKTKPPKPNTTMGKKAKVGKHVPKGSSTTDRLLGEVPRSKRKSGPLKQEKEAPSLIAVDSNGLNKPRAARLYVVPNGLATLEDSNRVRYTDEELEEFRVNIMEKLKEARTSHALLTEQLAYKENGTSDTDSHTKDMEDGSETLGRETNAVLAGRQEKLVRYLEDALVRIKNKSYGVCRVTGRLISKERLRLVPHATMSIEAKVSRN